MGVAVGVAALAINYLQPYLQKKKRALRVLITGAAGAIRARFVICLEEASGVFNLLPPPRTTCVVVPGLYYKAGQP